MIDQWYNSVSQHSGRHDRKKIIIHILCSIVQFDHYIALSHNKRISENGNKRKRLMECLSFTSNTIDT